MAVAPPSSLDTGRSTLSARSTSQAREIRDDVLGPAQDSGVLWPPGALGEIGEVVADDEQNPTGREGRTGHAPSTRRRCSAGRWRYITRTTSNEARGGSQSTTSASSQFTSTARVSRQLTGDRETDTGEVDARDGPTLAGEPHRVAPATAGEVERAARCRLPESPRRETRSGPRSRAGLRLRSARPSARDS